MAVWSNTEEVEFGHVVDIDAKTFYCLINMQGFKQKTQQNCCIAIYGQMCSLSAPTILIGSPEFWDTLRPL